MCLENSKKNTKEGPAKQSETGQVAFNFSLQGELFIGYYVFYTYKIKYKPLFEALSWKIGTSVTVKGLLYTLSILHI